jgi:cell division protease FtsH
VLAVLLLANWLASLLIPTDTVRRDKIPYSAFMEQVRAGNVAEVTTKGDLVRGRFVRAIALPTPASGATATVAGQGSGGEAEHEQRTSEYFETRLPAFTESQLDALRQSGVVVSAEPAETGRPLWLSILISVGPAVLLFGGLLWLSARAQRAQGGLLSIGRSRAKRVDTASTRERTTFADVAGIDEAKAELEEIVDFLRAPAKYQRLGGRVPRGVLLVGPPGTGKTLLARAVAGEAGVPYFSLSASEFVEMVVGVGAARVRDLFANAKKEAPAIVFIDELDAIGRRRGGIGFGGANQEQEQTLNQILAEMDGFSDRELVIVLAATNRPDVLDPALLRPGRFDRRVTVQRPDRVGRQAILKVHTRGVPLAGDVDLANLAALTPGLVGAELRNLVNEAALLAARRNGDVVTREDFDQAMEKIVLGAERKLAMTDLDRRRVAYHEAGHALVALRVPGADPLRKVSIVPHGESLGVTYQLPLNDRHNYGEDYLRGRLQIMLGGRAAEEGVFGVVSNGAEHDLKSATQLARQMVARWGMSDKVGLIYAAAGGSRYLESDAAPPEPAPEISPDLASQIDEDVQGLLDERYAAARETLDRDRRSLDALAEALLERESLEEREILEVTATTTATAAPPGTSTRTEIARVRGAPESPVTSHKRTGTGP